MAIVSDIFGDNYGEAIFKNPTRRAVLHLKQRIPFGMWVEFFNMMPQDTQLVDIRTCDFDRETQFLLESSMFPENNPGGLTDVIFTLSRQRREFTGEFYDVVTKVQVGVEENNRYIFEKSV